MLTFMQQIVLIYKNIEKTLVNCSYLPKDFHYQRFYHISSLHATHSNMMLHSSNPDGKYSHCLMIVNYICKRYCKLTCTATYMHYILEINKNLRFKKGAGIAIKSKETSSKLAI